MNIIDWLVLGGTLLFIIIYGAWKTRKTVSMESYTLGDRSAAWWTVGLSVMATQASAITFLSTPGQAYSDGLRFVQFYFGLAPAMVVLAIFFIPRFFALNVYTAYQFLEERFDVKTRSLTAFLFLLQRGLSAGLTIYAPAIILSTLLGWDLHLMIIVLGAGVTLYTVSGGTRAVSVTQQQQMAIILVGMVAAFVVAVMLLPKQVSLGDALSVAGAFGKMNPVDTTFDLSNRYNIWSGLLGGFFLSLAYFGSDQSQVQRYISARSITQSRLGLLFNGMMKVPMQFGILLTGVMVFVFYQFQQPPLFFNSAAYSQAKAVYSDTLQALEKQHDLLFAQKRDAVLQFTSMPESSEQEKELVRKQILGYQGEIEGLRKNVKEIIRQQNPKAEVNDADYVFLRFVTENLPVGLVGLLLAVIFSAAMSSTASELNALATTTTVDFVQRFIRPAENDAYYVRTSKIATVIWGILAMTGAALASLVENLIQAVNIVGSVFYGPVLGVFLAAFFLKHARGSDAFWAALVGQAIVFLMYYASDIGFLWYNLIGCGVVVLLAFAISTTRNAVQRHL